MKTIDDIDLKGKKVLVRVDFNVPLNEQHEVTDDTRIRATLPTIKKIVEDGGSSILMAHLGRPKGEYDEDLSLKHLVPYLKEHLSAHVKFAPDCVGEKAQQEINGLKEGDVLLLENLRFHKEEKEGDEGFAKQLASLADVYVNDAFGAAHRAHASTAVIAQFFQEKAFGYVMKREQENAARIMQEAEKPFTAVLGGAKVSDKLPVIENLLHKIDNLVLGGGMAYTFLKAQGGDVGDSQVEEDKLEKARELLERAKERNIRVLLPEDSVVAKEAKEDAETQESGSKKIQVGWKGLDIGPEARKAFSDVIGQSKTILWNGPMGVFEKEQFAGGTKAIAEAIAKATEENQAFSLVGGGETTAALQQLGYADRVSFVSTGGGALLEYIGGKELPGIKAIEQA
ncbi:MAG: phosphoglycerate kinase [Hymenobacteraceae bacterium]|nr:phosphoglycerate kinase [Hymenobacteraceae bacterium]